MDRPWLKQYAPGTPADIDPNSYGNLLELVDECVRKFGDRIAFTNRIKVYEQNITYRELDHLSKNFAAYLQNILGLQKGDRIAIQMPNLLQYPIAMIGAMRAGLTIVNTNPLYTPREMMHQFRDSGAKAILILDMFADKLEQVLLHTPIEHVIITSVADCFPSPLKNIINWINGTQNVPKFHLYNPWTTFDVAMKAGAKLNYHPVSLTNDDVAFLQYTGGTTGVSKGAVLTHGNIVANLVQIYEWLKIKLEEGKETVVTPLPLYHIFALTCNCFAFMKFGGRNLLITNPRDLAGFLDQLTHYNFTVLTGVNTLFNGMMNHPDFGKVNWRNLKASVGGAMALQGAVVQRWEELTKSPLIEGYGLTEASPVVTVNRVDGQDRKGTIGLPISSTLVKLVDDEGKEVTALNERGELCVKGPQVMRGYWNRPEETANVLNEDGWLRTGDIAVWTDDYFLKIVDRKKDMVLVSGFNVYPNEVEDVVAKFPGVLEVACIGVPDDKTGEAVKIIVVPKGHGFSESALRDYCRENLTGYKLPKFIEVRHTELPKSNVGKILRRILREEDEAKRNAHHHSHAEAH